MKLNFPLLWIGLIFLVTIRCSANSELNTETPEMEIDDQTKPDDTNPENQSTLKILSLGDSYTIGESVCATCRFPEQLKDSIKEKIADREVELKVIARTGWTTTALKSAISNETLAEDYDLATLLIGVNNQYQRRPFDVFEKEFPELVSEAIKYASGKKANLIVISIPDYAFTPFGNGNSSISQDINIYNNYIEDYCKQYSITYVFITDITRQGLENPNLVASDGLHPSTFAYTQFVSRMLPSALEKIGYTTD